MRRLSVKITSNAKTLSSFSGLHVFADLFHKFELQALVHSYLPKKKRNSGWKSSEKLYAGVLGFVAGANCLDDFDWLGSDPLFHDMTRSPSSVTMGKFLRAFSPRQIEQVRNSLPALALKQRLWLEPKLHKIVFRMDATTHEQYGEKMEGVEYNYKNIKCLSSQTLFDDKGFCYGFNLRAGAVHTSVGAIEMMENAFNVVPKDVKKYLVADSGYASLDIYNHLITKQTHFAICLGEKAWGSLLTKYGNKITWRKTRLKFFKSNKCEIGSCLYPLKGLAEKKSHLRVVFIRTKIKNPVKGDNHPYLYYAIVTDLSSAEMNDEHIIRFYRKRAIIENNIKDLKQGMDFYHFPCQSLKANNVWGLMGIMAYNLMRLTSFTISKNGCFTQTVRKKIVMIAGELVKHARYLEIRLSDYLAKEVNKLKMILCRLHFEIDKDRLRPFSTE
jgi:hypothetical protein